ncbi:alpha/beta fold hydrolase [Xanthobacter sediminis]
MSSEPEHTPTIQWIEVEGTSIEYAWCLPGPGDDDRLPVAPIVFLHHGFGCVADWKSFPGKVAQATGIPALVYSRRGCGASSPLLRPHDTNYLHEEAHQFMPMLLDALGVQQCHVYGHSDGSTIALLFASAFPDRALSSVVEAPHVFAEGITLKSMATMASRFERDPDFREKLSKYRRDLNGAF